MKKLIFILLGVLAATVLYSQTTSRDQSMLKKQDGSCLVSANGQTVQSQTCTMNQQRLKQNHSTKVMSQKKKMIRAKNAGTTMQKQSAARGNQKNR
jgi:hypothetical protein